MGSRRVYSAYKRLVEDLGLKQLDVYRGARGGKVSDKVRIYDPSSGKVALIDMGGPRESFSPKEFVERLVQRLKESGITVSERSLKRVLERLES